MGVLQHQTCQVLLLLFIVVENQPHRSSTIPNMPGLIAIIYSGGEPTTWEFYNTKHARYYCYYL